MPLDGTYSQRLNEIRRVTCGGKVPQKLKKET
jgi:hypothetical protein